MSWDKKKKQSSLGTDPFIRTYEWDSTRKQFKFWNKFPEGGGENIYLSKLQGVVLHEFHAISGYSEEHKTGYYSNMTNSLKDKFFVRLSGRNQVVANGVPSIFPDGKKNMVLRSNGMKSTRVLLIWDSLIEVTDDEGNKSFGGLSKVSLAGSGYGAYIDLTKKLNTRSLVGYWLAFVGKTYDKKQGNVTYNVPVFRGGELDVEKPKQKKMDDDAREIYDSFLEDWITNYLGTDAESIVDSGEAKPDNQETNLQTGLPPADNFPTQEPTTIASTGGAHTEEDDLPF